MPGRSLTIQQILTIITETPPRITALTSGLAAEQLSISPDPDEWSANEVLAHLRACADVWGSSIETILTQDMPVIRAINPRTWIERTDYRQQEFLPSLQAFTKQRLGLLAILETLTPADWSRSATITGAGKPLVKSVFSYAERMALHERPHVKQIERLVKNMH